MKAEIIAVGTELLLGDIVNTNSAFLASRLAQLGFDMHYQMVLGDNPEHIIAAARTASQRSDVVIFTGGLGPTDDDLTREAVARAFSLELVVDEVTKKRIAEYFRCRGMVCACNNAKQAKVFARGEVLQNENGTAPGLYCNTGRTVVILLPGPPHELEALFDAQVAPRLHALCGESIRSVTLKCFGVPESQLEVILGEQLKTANPTAALYAKRGEVHIRVTAKAADETAALELCRCKAAEIRALLPDNIYTDDERTLAAVVVDILKEKGLVAASAESITGGRIAAALTACAGASQVFHCGIVSYTDEIKHTMLGVKAETLRTKTAVSAETASEMANGVRINSGSDWGVATTGYAGPSGAQVGLVFAAVSSAERTVVKQFNFGSMRSRENVQTMCLMNALDMLRRELLGIENDGAQVFTAK